MRLADTRIAAIGPRLTPATGDAVIDAGGAALLPGLHDHHIHLVALAASLVSLHCGPPHIQSQDELAALLASHNPAEGAGWLRGTGYHPCVAGAIDRLWLDRHIPDRPVRIQHRGGRLWVLNSRALLALGLHPDKSTGAEPAGLERSAGRATGRLYEEDRWLRERLPSQLPNLRESSALLASCGVTGITDTTPTNGSAEWAYFQQAQLSGDLRQRVRMMGNQQIASCADTALLTRGEFKIHLLESRLPPLDALCRDIQQAHRSGRAVAVHCVTETELVYTLSALQTAGVRAGDRIEHASITPPALLPMIRALELRVVTQPHFIAERGDQYRADIPAAEQAWLYRCAGLLAAGIPLAGGSDAPFGSADPWRAMRAAVERKTPSGEVLGSSERLNPEQALALYLSPAAAPGNNDLARDSVWQTGQQADLCLLDCAWPEARHDLNRGHVRCTWLAGELSYSAT